MSYDPKDRKAVMLELMKPIDNMIMLCDDEQDLYALGSILLVSAKRIFVNNLGRDKAREVFRMAFEEIYDGKREQ